MQWNIVTTLFVVIFVAHNGFELVLDWLQARHLARRRETVPSHLKGKVDLATIQKSVDYNRHKIGFGFVGWLHGTAALWFMILFGFEWLNQTVLGLGVSALPAGFAFFGMLAIVGALYDFPLELYGTFVIETKYGFNRQTLGSFLLDKAKGIVVSAILGSILLGLVLGLMEYGGEYWWIFAFAVIALFQIVAMWIYPLVIMPLFNEFTPVDGPVAQQIKELADKVGFPLSTVVSMDGSKRSTHANAFFIGLRGARRIVLYDTLLEKTSIDEILGVVGHELGHFKLGHLRKRLVIMFVGLFVFLGVLSQLRGLETVYQGLGLSTISSYGALIVFALLIGEIASPLGWGMRILSRREEFEADRFAVDLTQSGAGLSGALIRLTKQNLSSPGSHKLYRSYYNTHPPLRHRLNHIANFAKEKDYPWESLTAKVDVPVAPESDDKVDSSDTAS